MQHLVASSVEVSGTGKKTVILPKPATKQPFFGEWGFTPELRQQWNEFYQDVAVLAFPAGRSTIGLDLVPEVASDFLRVTEIEEKALYYRQPYSSMAGVKQYLTFSEPQTDDNPVEMEQIIDLTSALQPDGSLEWDVPDGQWTVMRFGSRNNGSKSRPAPQIVVGFESDKFDTIAINIHLDNFVEKLFRQTGFKKARPGGGGLQMLHIDSWEWALKTGRRAFAKNL